MSGRFWKRPSLAGFEAPNDRMLRVDRHGVWLGDLRAQRTGLGGKLVRDLYVNRADRKRDEVRIWTHGGIETSGEVFSGPWGELRKSIARLVPADFDQVVIREDVMKADGKWIWMWRCPQSRDRWSRSPSPQSRDRWSRSDGGTESTANHDGAASADGVRHATDVRRPCLGLVRQLYWPMPAWSIAAAVSEEANGWASVPIGGGFLCRHCAGLVYESSERRWGRGGGRGGDERGREGQSVAIAWDRFVQRMSLGMLRGREVAQPRGFGEGRGGV